MKTLWTFGDSLTDYFNPPPTLIKHWRHEYIEWKGYVPKVFGEIVSEKLNYNYVNTAMGGCSNNQIFEEFCKVCDLIKTDDILIFGWTNQERFRLSNIKNGWTNFYINFRKKNTKELKDHFFNLSLEQVDSISKETIQQIMFNRSNPNYVIEVENWIKLINLSFSKNKIIHWSWDERMKNSSTIIELNKFENIRTETNGEINDPHWSESGQSEMANLILEIINNENKKNII